jgi:hypothetical protein
LSIQIADLNSKLRHEGSRNQDRSLQLS